MDGIRTMLTDAVWARFEVIIHAAKSRAGAPPRLSDRDFVEAILHIGRCSMPWRDLPACFGNWDAVYNRFRRWEGLGIWQALFEQSPAELESIRTLFIDSTIIRAHPHAAGAPAKKGVKRVRPWADVAEASPRKSTSRRGTSRLPLSSS